MFFLNYIFEFLIVKAELQCQILDVLLLYVEADGSVVKPIIQIGIYAAMISVIYRHTVGGVKSVLRVRGLYYRSTNTAM